MSFPSEKWFPFPNFSCKLNIYTFLTLYLSSSQSKHTLKSFKRLEWMKSLALVWNEKRGCHSCLAYCGLTDPALHENPTAVWTKLELPECELELYHISDQSCKNPYLKKLTHSGHRTSAWSLGGSLTSLKVETHASLYRWHSMILSQLCFFLAWKKGCSRTEFRNCDYLFHVVPCYPPYWRLPLQYVTAVL